MAVTRRLAGLLVVVALVAGVPLAAARASCVCDHGHDHAGGASAAKPHTCTAACTPATCPMHRRASAGADRRPDDPGAHRAATPSRDGISCSCAGEAQALIGQATTAALLPPAATLAEPPSNRLVAGIPSAAASSLVSTPPAPPPRA